MVTSGHNHAGHKLKEATPNLVKKNLLKGVEEATKGPLAP